jgi:hypothetical protein
MTIKNSTLSFRRSLKMRAIDEFPSKSDVSEVLAFVRDQKVPGELVVSLPGNGGVSGIVFRTKEAVHQGEME